MAALASLFIRGSDSVHSVLKLSSFGLGIKFIRVSDSIHTDFVLGSFGLRI